jgi:hypothetical protein
MMGESRGGEGRSEATTLDQFAAELGASVMLLDFEVGEVLVQRRTAGLYSVAIQEHGATDATVYSVEADGDSFLVSAPTPVGGEQGESG